MNFLKELLGDFGQLREFYGESGTRGPSCGVEGHGDRDKASLFFYICWRVQTPFITSFTYSKIFEERTNPEVARMRMSESTDRLSCKQIPAVKCRRPELRWPIWDMTGPASISCGLIIIVQQLVFKPAPPELPPSWTSPMLILSS